MRHIFNLKMASQTAEAFLKEEGIARLPVDPFAIAASRDIDVKGKPEKTEGVSGMLLRHGNNFGIVYATHIPSLGFQRFSISHELGHYFLLRAYRSDPENRRPRFTGGLRHGRPVRTRSRSFRGRTADA